MVVFERRKQDPADEAEVRKNAKAFVPEVIERQDPSRGIFGPVREDREKQLGTAWDEFCRSSERIKREQEDLKTKQAQSRYEQIRLMDASLFSVLKPQYMPKPKPKKETLKEKVQRLENEVVELRKQYN